ncbi:MAG: hypothetical protein F6K31_30905 [Symploca sp. SIO2G7]|nr:hypothetical protein [Symploca sp. SIO2G7]
MIEFGENRSISTYPRICNVHPILMSQFPIPNSQFSILNSQFSIPTPLSPLCGRIVSCSKSTLAARRYSYGPDVLRHRCQFRPTRW